MPFFAKNPCFFFPQIPREYKILIFNYLTIKNTWESAWDLWESVGFVGKRGKKKTIFPQDFSLKIVFLKFYDFIKY